MRNNLKNVLVVTLVAGLCLPIVGIATADQPTYRNITLDPEEPARQSDVTFTVDITGDNIEEVWLTVEECTNIPTYFCHFEKLNVSMRNVENDTWEVTEKLVFDDTTEGHCWLVVKNNGIWYDYSSDKTKYTNFTVVPGDNGADNNGTDGGNKTGKTPGFELILVIVSIVVALFIYKRKRN